MIQESCNIEQISFAKEVIFLHMLTDKAKGLENEIS